MSGSVFLVFPISNDEVGTFVFDAIVSEETALQSAITEYAVEEGADITDNIAAAKETLSLSGVLTGASVVEGATESGRAKLNNAKQMIRALMQRRDVVTVVTPAESYSDMGIASANISRGDPSERLAVTMQLKKILRVTARSVDVPRPKPAAKPKAGKTSANGGKTNGKPADPPPREQTALAKLTKGGKSVASLIGGQ